LRHPLCLQARQLQSASNSDQGSGALLTSGGQSSGDLFSRGEQGSGVVESGGAGPGSGSRVAILPGQGSGAIDGSSPSTAATTTATSGVGLTLTLVGDIGAVQAAKIEGLAKQLAISRQANADLTALVAALVVLVGFALFSMLRPTLS